MNVSEKYRAFGQACCVCLEKGLENGGPIEKTTRSHNFLNSYHTLVASVGSRPESELLELAAAEYETALLSLLQGHYRYAFSGLRLFVELSLAAIRFSAYEIEFHEWKAGNRDLNWQSIVNADTGIYSVNFVRAFSPDLANEGKQYRTLAEQVYRELSEHVHGNSKTHGELPKRLEFSEALFDLWHDWADTCCRLFLFAYSARHLRFLDAPAIAGVEDIILESLGHHEAIRFLIASKASEGK